MVSRRRQAGYTMAVLAVFLTVLSVGLAVALPKWSTAIRREQEEELIFRGLQYAEAIRVFQKRFGRYPISLEELLETKPRCIRQLWKEPMSEDGKWRLIRIGDPVAERLRGGMTPGTGLGGEPVPAEETKTEEETADGDGAGEDESGDGLTGGGGPGAAGPISGVRSRSKRASILKFTDQTRYSDWLFTFNLVVPGGAPLPGTPEAAFGVPGMVAGAGGLKIPNANWIGRPLPGGQTTPGQLPASPGMPGSPPPGEPEPRPEGEDGE
jgi:type II secretory pathway pseudopilin PulG